jgi:hypothetical protein
MATLKNIILELESSTGIRIYVNGQSRYQTDWNYYDSLAKMLNINYDSYMEALTDLLNWAKATWEELKDGIFGWNLWMELPKDHAGKHSACNEATYT